MKNLIFLLLFLCSLKIGCGEKFLDDKPSSSIVNPTTLTEFQHLLDNSSVLNITGALSQMASDEYYISSFSSFNALPTTTEKNSYLWKEDLFGGEFNIADWDRLYKAVFYANSVLDGLNAISIGTDNQEDINNLKGSAMFFRSFAFYDLARNFCQSFDETTASVDLGLPLRASAAIDITSPRSSLRETYDWIISDLIASRDLLRDDFSRLNRNRPSKAAVNALLARIYLSMGKYEKAEMAADACLDLYDELIDYNSIDTNSITPFSYTSNETIFHATQIGAYSNMTAYTDVSSIGIDTSLIKSYQPNDLRLSVYFQKNTAGLYKVKRGYVGGGYYPFTGLATDEVFLIKAECLAKKSKSEDAMFVLNYLLKNRYKTDSFVPITAKTSEEAIFHVVNERRKELVWRGLRWSDLKRFNKEGANIQLIRILDNEEYKLLPNSRRYVFPIPDDERLLSGIQQNIR